MTTAVVDLAPDEWRIARPRLVEVDHVHLCEHPDGCDHTAWITVTWRPLAGFGQLNACRQHANDALATALDDSPEDTQIAVEVLVRLPLSRSAA